MAVIEPGKEGLFYRVVFAGQSGKTHTLMIRASDPDEACHKLTVNHGTVVAKIKSIRKGRKA